MLCRVFKKVRKEDFWFISGGIKKEDADCIWSNLISDQENLEGRLQDLADQYFEKNPGKRVAVIPDGPYTIIQEN